MKLTKKTMRTKTKIYLKHPRGRGTRKTAIIGVKERKTNKVYAVVSLHNKVDKNLPENTYLLY